MERLLSSPKHYIQRGYTEKYRLSLQGSVKQNKVERHFTRRITHHALNGGKNSHFSDCNQTFPLIKIQAYVYKVLFTRASLYFYAYLWCKMADEP